MKSIRKTIKVIAFIWLSAVHVFAQEVSEMKVKYMLSYDSTKHNFVAWVVPSYETPNANNPDTEEKGVTAQFTFKIPKGVAIGEITSLKGTWETNPTKISNSEYIKGLDDRYDYYVVGKSPSETNYGSFKENEPVALFTFKTKGSVANAKALVVENHDMAVKTLNENYALNIASSFYSRSGQRASVSAKPLEQFQSETSLFDVLNGNIRKLNEQFSLGGPEIDLKNQMVGYPNPSSEALNVRILNTSVVEKINLELVDMKGMVVKSHTFDAKMGFNTFRIVTSGITKGTYLLRSQVGSNSLSTKVVVQ